MCPQAFQTSVTFDSRETDRKLDADYFACIYETVNIFIFWTLDNKI